MTIITRSITREIMTQAASYMFERSVRRISTLEILEGFVLAAEHRPSVALALDELEIKADCKSTFATPLVRTSLLLSSNVTDLTLNIPSAPAAIFVGVYFPHLTLFKSSVAHANLRVFLSRHDTLKFLILDRCGSRTIRGRNVRCPLQRIYLKAVIELTCPLPCSRVITGSEVMVLKCTDPKQLVLPSRLFALTPTRLYLDTLILDAQPDDFGLLSVLAITFPHLRCLKLIENSPQDPPFTPVSYMWMQSGRWARALKTIPLLQEVLVKTTAVLVETPGDEVLELRLLDLWTVGEPIVMWDMMEDPQPHPKLQHIGIWYGARTPVEGTLSHWYQEGYGWNREVHVVDTVHSEIFF